MATFNSYIILNVFLFLLSSNYVSPWWFTGSPDTCSSLYYVNFCSICYSTSNIMYFLSQVPYGNRCDYVKIGEQKNVTKKDIEKQQDEFMDKQSDEAKKRYQEYKKSIEEKKNESRERLDKEAKRLSQDASTLYNKIYSVMDNKNITLKQEYELAHTIIKETKFETVVEASKLIPSKFYSDTYNGHFVFYIISNPEECYTC